MVSTSDFVFKSTLYLNPTKFLSLFCSSCDATADTFSLAVQWFSVHLAWSVHHLEAWVGLLFVSVQLLSSNTLL